MSEKVAYLIENKLFVSFMRSSFIFSGNPCVKPVRTESNNSIKFSKSFSEQGWEQYRSNKFFSSAVNDEFSVWFEQHPITQTASFLYSSISDFSFCALQDSSW